MQQRRVVILGPGGGVLPGIYGARDFSAHFQSLLEGVSGISELAEPVLGERVHIKHGGRVFDFVPPAFPRRLTAHADRSILMSLVAAKIALQESGLPLASDGAIDAVSLQLDPFRIASAGGSGFGDGEAMARFHTLFMEGAWRTIGARAVPAVMPNGSTTTVAMMCGARGKSDTLSTACASSSDAFGNLFLYLKHGLADLGVVVGNDTLCNPFYTVLFGLATALSKTGRSLPFGAERDGFVLSEGAACGILAVLDSVKRWGIEHRILAEVVGYGATTDCREMTSPDLEGGCRAALLALEMAHSYGLVPYLIHTVIAHGTATRSGDLNESHIIPRVYPRDPLVYSPKAQVGHMMGAAGLVNILTGGHVLKTGSLPPLGDYIIDEECKRDKVRYAGDTSIKNPCYFSEALASHALGFGGQNSVVILRKFED